MKAKNELNKSLFGNILIICIFLLSTVIIPLSCKSVSDKTSSGDPELQQPVTVGADRLFSEFSHLIKDKTLALVSNHTGRLSDGTHLADTLYHYPDAELVALFGMSHNIRLNDYSLPRDKDDDSILQHYSKTYTQILPMNVGMGTITR